MLQRSLSKGPESDFPVRVTKTLFLSQRSGSRTSVLRQQQQQVHIASIIMMKHAKARCEYYPRENIKRYPVPDDKVSWDEPYPEYAPVDHTAPSVLSMPVWADIDFRNVHCNGEGQSEDIPTPLWNALDKKVNRRSHMGCYEIVDGVPRNPVGRTGLTGRGCLGRWGPNHAADPIVTRWKKNEKDELVIKDGLPVLQFIAVQRRDNGQWALPGGMVDPGEVVTMTLKREFGEEALNSLDATPAEKKHIEAAINNVFSKGQEIYRGYVDDPRNTDNAWMETVAINFHDAEGDGVAKLKLHAGDDAVGVKWTDLSSTLMLYASHIDFLRETAAKLGASW